VILRAIRLVAVALLGACSVARFNYTDPVGPRYAGGSPSAARHGDTLKVVTFNIQYGVHVHRAIQLIRGTDVLRNPDVLLLQEMDERGAREMADSLGLDYVYYPSRLHTGTQRDFGNAILSRYPIDHDRKIVLPHLARFNHTVRTAVGATIRVGARRVRLYSVHLATMAENGPGARREQLAAVLADAERYPTVVLGGDFNSGSVPEIAVAQGFAWPTMHLGHTRAIWDMDHVLLKGLEPAGSPAVGVVDEVQGASDHKPVWALVVLATGDVGASGSSDGARSSSGHP
jgi:endonuclease/exonuclease/phosphatase family metal-dependent hydrolase